MTVLESLRMLTAYPIPMESLEAIGIEVGLDLGDELSTVPSKSIYLAKSRTYMFVALAPNVSEGGVSISYTATERAYFMNLARKYAALAGEDGMIPGPAYGYKGENI